MSEPTAAPASVSPTMARVRPPTRRERLWAIGLGVAAFAVLAATESRVGFVRDEGYYFRAADDTGRWYALLVERPGEALSRASVDAHFSYNSEHPVLMKTLFGLSHRLFVGTLHVLRDAAGYRLPAWAMAGLLVAVLYLWTAALVSHRAGVAAAAAYLLVPRDLFNSTLACFDGPMATMWLATAYAYWRSLASRRWALVAGVAFGLSIAVKHNGYFLPPVLALHFALTDGVRAWRSGGAAAVLRGFPRAFVAMAILGPAVFFAHWPYLWFDPVGRMSAYLGFHTQHINYPWHYLGRLLMDPPFPVGYPFVVTALTVPLSILVPMATGLFAAIVRLGRGAVSRTAPLDADTLLVVLNALVPMAIIAHPSVPVFGGAKHWLPAVPFLLVLAAVALERAAGVLRAIGPLGARAGSGPAGTPKSGRAAFAALALLAAAPALWGSWRIHPYGTSFYNELAGSSPGAASLGMQRHFWSNNVTGVIAWVNQNAPPNARIWFHEVNPESFEAYRRNGMLRLDLQYAFSADDSAMTAHQYMQEFREQEFEVWTRYGADRPVSGLYVDEVPNVVVYLRP